MNFVPSQCESGKKAEAQSKDESVIGSGEGEFRQLLA
jgi:hypothetical protein